MQARCRCAGPDESKNGEARRRKVSTLRGDRVPEPHKCPWYRQGLYSKIARVCTITSGQPAICIFPCRPTWLHAYSPLPVAFWKVGIKESITLRSSWEQIIPVWHFLPPLPNPGCRAKLHSIGEEELDRTVKRSECISSADVAFTLSSLVLGRWPSRCPTVRTYYSLCLRTWTHSVGGGDTSAAPADRPLTAMTKVRTRLDGSVRSSGICALVRLGLYFVEPMKVPNNPFL